MMNIFLDLCRRIQPQFCETHDRIAGLSLGGERDFYLKNKADGKLVEKYLLQNGDMVVMQGETQSKWQHAIPKRTHAAPRIK
jgi:alkylated DNA repair dioxygenase AlkB